MGIYGLDPNTEQNILAGSGTVTAESSVGAWDGVFKATGQGIVQNAATVNSIAADLYTPALTPLAKSMDSLLGTTSEQFFINSQAGANQAVVNLMPDANVGLFGHIGYGFTSTIPAVVGGAVLGGPMGGGASVGMVAGYQDYLKGRSEGLDEGTALARAGVMGSTFAVGAVLPMGVGGSLAKSVGVGISVNAGLGMASRASISELLEHRGYDDMATQYQALDRTALLTDIVLGAAFGGVARYMHKGREQVPQADIDASLANNLTHHAEIDAAPGVPLNPQSRLAQSRALNESIESLIHEREPDFSKTGIEDAEFLPIRTETNARIQAAVDDLRAPLAKTLDEVDALRQELKDMGIEVSDEPLLTGSVLQNAPEPTIKPVLELNIPETNIGRATELHVGESVHAATFNVVEANSLTPAIGKADNQFRDRSRAASQIQISKISNDLKFGRLGESPTMTEGAPTVSRDGQIIGGNGRVAAINKAYGEGKASKYRAELEAKAAEYGLDPEVIKGMENPVLVRRFDNDVDIRHMAILSNEGGGLRMSGLEQSKVDAERMPSLSGIDVPESGDMNTAGMRGFVRDWLRQIPTDEQAALVTADGSLSQEGVLRARNGLLYKAYGDNSTLARLVESADESQRNVANALIKAAPKVAEVRDMIESGDLHDRDVQPMLLAAVDKYADLKAQGMTVKDYESQASLFGDDMGGESMALLRFLEENRRSAKAISTAITDYYDAIERLGNPRQANMFDAEVPSRAEILAAVLRGEVHGSQDVLFSLARPDLIITHNLTEANLLHAKKMGGIAVPSLAVTRAENPLTGFGEITLIGDRSLADPKSSGAQVFGADIYSPRYPTVEVKVNRKAYAQVEKSHEAMGEKTGQSFPDESYIGTRASEKMLLAENNAIMGKFLEGKGIEPEVVHEKMLSDEKVAAYKADGLGDYLTETDQYKLQDDPIFFKKVVDATIKQYESSGSKIAVKLAGEMKTDESAQRSAVRSRATEIASSAKRTLKPLPDRFATKKAMQKQIEDAGLKSELNRHVDNLVSVMSDGERIFKGYSNSGNKTYTPHTLENVVKILKKELRGGEGFSYGVGSLRAKFTPQFKTLDVIRKNKSRLVSEADFEKVKKEIDDALFNLQSVAGVDRSETMISILEDAPNMGLDRAAAYYSVKLSDEAKAQAVNFLNHLRELPTSYFEAKILRSVSPSEFRGAIVPDNISEDALKYLHDNGVTDIRKYKADNDADRASKINEFEHLMFSQSDAIEMATSKQGRIELPEANDVQANYIAQVERSIKQTIPDFALRAAESVDASKVDDLRMVQKLARDVFDKDLIAVEQPEGRLFSAAYNPALKDAVFLDVNAPEPAMQLVGHELVHAMRNDRPELYDRLARDMQDILKDQPVYAKELNDIRKSNGMRPLDVDKMTEEHIADVSGELFVREDFLKLLEAKDKNVFVSLIQHVRDFVIKTLMKLDGIMNRDSWIDPKATKLVHDLDKSRIIMAKVFNEYKKGIQADVKKTVKSDAMLDRTTVFAAEQALYDEPNSRIVASESYPTSAKLELEQAQNTLERDEMDANGYDAAIACAQRG